ncbi:MAG: class I SAM-dependent methyltransferase [Chloroflexi bacterium]|nr:class I SAM-dependent methyltransferase [Chloroflexota bacterium]
MPDLQEIYEQHADQYELLASREDYQGNILRTLQEIRSLAGLDVVDLGAGTGRLTCLLAPIVRSIHAVDSSAHMLEVATAKLQKSGLHNWQVHVADHRRLPLADRSADLVIAGWSICYLAIWQGPAWRDELAHGLTEIKRILRPGGTIIILETLGTGYEIPHPPGELLDYYAFLDAEGFLSTWIRTDYRFESLAEAETLARFFFGDELAHTVAQKNWTILPECTGLWWMHLPQPD